jgi:hypothetical protein
VENGNETIFNHFRDKPARAWAVLWKQGKPITILRTRFSEFSLGLLNGQSGCKKRLLLSLQKAELCSHQLCMMKVGYVEKLVEPLDELKKSNCCMA